MFTLEKLREIDTIEVNMNNELLKEFRRFTKFDEGKTTKHLNLNFFLLKGVLKINLDDTERYYYFDINNNNEKPTIYIEVYESYSMYFVYYGNVSFELSKPENARIQMNKKLGKEFLFNGMKFLKNIPSQFIFHFYHLTEIIDNRKVEVKESKPKLAINTAANNTAIKSVNNIKNNVVNLKSTKYEYIIKTAEELEVFKRSYTKHTEAWTVAGHERRYKNGKTVYIKPYTKGQGKKKQKIYKA